ncbi:MAG TPA: hypothetical protein VIJ92_14615 [Ginsengibacter sp.]
MNESQSTGIYWLYFFLSAIGIILMLVFVREYFWMALPFVVTTFAKALRIM